MNRLIAKTLGALNAALFVFIAIIIPVAYMASPAAKQSDGAMSFVIVVGCVLTGLALCGFVAFLSRISDSLDRIKELLEKERS
jgi:hypothetical protein